MKKKIFTAVLAVISALMLSSCIIVDWDDWYDDYHEYEGDYTITVDNSSSYKIKDWYVIDEKNYRYYPKTREVRSGDSSTLRYVDAGYYRIVFKLGPYDYEKSREFRVDSNRTFTVTNYKDWDEFSNLKQTDAFPVEITEIAE